MDRKWPLVICTKHDTLHISMQNAPGCKVRTECGHDMDYRATYTGTPDQLRKPENNLVKGKYDFQGPYKMCKRCGKPEDFAEALEEYLEKHGSFMTRLRKKEDYVRQYVETYRKAMIDQLAVLVRDMVGDSLADDNISPSKDGLGVEFKIHLPTMGPFTMVLSLGEEEAKEAEENWHRGGTWKFESEEQEDVQDKA